MSGKPIKIPGPDHPITVEHNPSRVVVKLGGRVIADTHDALTLREASYPPVQYIPRKDVDMSLLERTEHESERARHRKPPRRHSVGEEGSTRGRRRRERQADA